MKMYLTERRVSQVLSLAGKSQFNKMNIFAKEIKVSLKTRCKQPLQKTSYGGNYL